jgi:RNA polymerase primary sigma factor
MAARTSTAADDGSSALVHQNLRLVAMIGRQFANRGVDATDLIQEGSIGLIKASRRFDETRGVRFSTYAAWWIRQGMGRAIAEQGRTVRLPYHVRGALREVAQTAHDLVGKLGRPPAPAEIAARMASTPEKVERLLDFRVPTVSLDAPASRPNDESPLIDRLTAPGTEQTPEEVLEGRARSHAIREALDRLPARERSLLAMRFGIDREACSLQDAAANLAINVHRARQLEQRALKKLKHNPTLVSLIAGNR